MSLNIFIVPFFAVSFSPFRLVTEISNSPLCDFSSSEGRLIANFIDSYPTDIASCAECVSPFKSVTSA
ncbi:MAG TPA: hypothetical protein PL028_06935 [Bacteroidales bacterium]|nr:hypothetical protein [Bacteroidales bacterium]